jgi:hypothetical protein
LLLSITVTTVLPILQTDPIDTADISTVTIASLLLPKTPKPFLAAKIDDFVFFNIIIVRGEKEGYTGRTQNSVERTM